MARVQPEAREQQAQRVPRQRLRSVLQLRVLREVLQVLRTQDHRLRRRLISQSLAAIPEARARLEVQGPRGLRVRGDRTPGWI